ncbi:MAG: hypothetical protein WD467_00315 [Candidatus Saccharimonadales bacterium]
MSGNLERAPRQTVDSEPFLLRLVSRQHEDEELDTAIATLSQVAFLHPDEDTFSRGWSLDELRRLNDTGTPIRFSIYTKPFDRLERYYYRSNGSRALVPQGRLVTELSQPFHGDTIAFSSSIPLVVDTIRSLGVSLRGNDLVTISRLEMDTSLLDLRLKELMCTDEIRRHSDGTLFVPEASALKQGTDRQSHP